jgi:hypothetical protein
MHTLDEFIDKLTQLSSNSALSILEIGATILEAKRVLPEKEYDEFLSKTKYSENSASVRKWHCVGQAYFRLKPIVHLLPPNWSTIYRLSQLTPVQLNYLVEQNKLLPCSTMKDIESVLNCPSKKHEPQFVTLEFESHLSPDDVRTTLDELVIFNEKFKIKLNNKMTNFLSNCSTNE